MKRASLVVLGLGCTFAGSALAQESPPAPPKRNMMPHVPPVVLPQPKGATPGATPPVAPPAPAPEPAPKPMPPVVPVAPPSPPVAQAPQVPVSPPVAPAPHVPPGHRPGPLPAPQAPTHPPVAAAPPSPPVTACPPGAFCEPATTEPPPPAPPPPVAEQPAPPPYTVPLPPPRPGSDPTRPRVIVVTPGQNGAPDDIVVYDDGAYPPPPPPPPRPVTYGPHGRYLRPLPLLAPPMFGLNLRAEAALLSEQRYGYRDYGMGGIGASLRYRPVPAVALDAGIDIIGGTDTNGFARREVPLSISTMLYLNPRSFAQFYFMGGLNLSFARVASNYIEPNFAGGSTDDYTYVGGQFGGGVEFRMTRAVAFNVDLLGTLRSRVDSDGNGRYPEYYEARTGLSSNSSGGGLLRAGLTLWW